MTKVTRSAIENALDIHTKEGRLGGWQPRRDRPTGYVILLNDYEPVFTASLRETWLLVAGLTSAHKGQLSREEAASR